MNLSDMERSPGARFLLVTACLVVIVYGLRLAAPILQLFFLALFLAVLSFPIMLRLRKRRFPTPLAIGITVLLDVAVLGFLIFVGIRSFQQFQTRFPVIQARFRQLTTVWVDGLENLGIPAGDFISTQVIVLELLLGFFGNSALGLVGGTVQWVAMLLIGAFLVVIVMIFILDEATVFPRKLGIAFGSGAGTSPRLAKMVKEVQAYLGIKTLVSLATGITVGVATWLMGLDLPVLLGLIAFLLNFIPNIGSVIAAIPAVIIAFLGFGIGRALLVALLYLAVNIVYGNFLEPSLLGRRLGLSTLVVVLSLLFWTWVWGVVGAILAVPLTMVVKIMLENTEDLRWVAQMLDKQPLPVPTEAVIKEVES